MQESKIIRPEHTLLVPYAVGVFGKMRSMILAVRFDVGQYEDGSRSLKVIALTGTEECGKVYDMMYLVDDGDGEGLDNDLMVGLIGNEEFWDKEHLWWYEDEPEETK